MAPEQSAKLDTPPKGLLSSKHERKIKRLFGWHKQGGKLEAVDLVLHDDKGTLMHQRDHQESCGRRASHINELISVLLRPVRQHSRIGNGKRRRRPSYPKGCGHSGPSLALSTRSSSAMSACHIASGSMSYPKVIGTSPGTRQRTTTRGAVSSDVRSQTIVSSGMSERLKISRLPWRCPRRSLFEQELNALDGTVGR